ncbi:VOC family protein [Streptomyces sp. NBC_00390]
MAAFTEGAPCWVDASLPDVEAGKRFYGDLFGWTFVGRGGEELPGGGTRSRYADAYSGDKLVAALVPKRDGRMPTVWSVYFATPDAVALSRRIREAGGQMIMDPLPVGKAGVVAVAADPGGAVFGLWQAGDQPGFEKMGVPGTFCWTEVYTRDKDTADDFYESVFGFQGTDLPGAPVDFRMWSPAGTEPGERTAVGGRTLLTDAFPAEMPGHFLVYFCVEDCDWTAETVVRLGGRVQAPPFDIPYGRIAVLTDNQGAAFAVLSEPSAPGQPADQRADRPAEQATGRAADQPPDQERGGEQKQEEREAKGEAEGRRKPREDDDADEGGDAEDTPRTQES